MDTADPQFVGWTAILAGAISAISVVCLVLLFVVGEPFGTINDALSIPVAFLLLPLIVGLYRNNSDQHILLGLLAMIAGGAGFLLIAIGSALLIFERIDFQSSLLFAMGGLALVGIWLLLNSALGLFGNTMPKGLAWSGIFLALGPTIGLLAVFRLETLEALLNGLAGQGSMEPVSMFAYPVVILGALSYVLIPFWLMWIGRLFVIRQFGSAVPALAAR